MAFTPTTLATTQLLETTFISDMRLIVNANTTLLKTQIEDIINDLQIDLVNKYIGVDLPIAQVYSQDAVLSNQLILKAGTSGTSATIASLTQTAGVSYFLSDNVSFTKTVQSTALGSKVATPTVVVGTTTGNTPIDYPTSGGAGIADRGLYIGDTLTPIPSYFYGEVNVQKQAIQQSSVFSRTITLSKNGSGTFTYANLVIAKTDPQFIYLNLQLPAAYTQTPTNPIYLLLHEDYTAGTSRPAVGQTFTIIINQIIDSSSAQVPTSSWPIAVAASSDSSTAGIYIMPGYIQSPSTGSGNAKIGYINSSTWGSVPGTGTGAATSALSGMSIVRLFNRNVQSGSVPSKLGASLSLTKTQEATNFSSFTITNSQNIALLG